MVSTLLGESSIGGESSSPEAAGLARSADPAFANVGNLVEFTSACTFQNAIVVGFDTVHTELVAATLSDTLTWDSDVLQPCAAHLVFGGVTSYNPL